MGVVKIEETARPDRAIHLNGERMYWPPAGCITHREAARRIFPSLDPNDADKRLRAMRTAKDVQDRGPMWLTAPNAHHIAYTPDSVRNWLRARGEKLAAQGAELLARAAEPVEESVS